MEMVGKERGLLPFHLRHLSLHSTSFSLDSVQTTKCWAQEKFMRWFL